MRARKRNPYWGNGLDKRQARRARRCAARVVAFAESATGCHLDAWQQAALLAMRDIQPRTRRVVVSWPRQYGRGPLAQAIIDEVRADSAGDAERFVLNTWVKEKP